MITHIVVCSSYIAMSDHPYVKALSNYVGDPLQRLGGLASIAWIFFPSAAAENFELKACRGPTSEPSGKHR